MFEFFNLPRELRDKAYDELLNQEQIVSSLSKGRLCARMQGCAQLNHLLVNHRFRAELSEPSHKLSGFIAEGAMRHFKQLDLPKLLPPVHRAEVRIVIEYCRNEYHHENENCDMEASEYVKERVLDRLSEISSLQEIYFNVFLDPEWIDSLVDDPIPDCQKTFSELPNDQRVKAINIYNQVLEKIVQPVPAWRSPLNFGSKDLILHYTPQTSGLQRVRSMLTSIERS